MNLTQRRRLLKLARFLEKLPASKFDFSEIVTFSKKVRGHECGTVCCAIGWTPKVFPKTWKWEEYYDFLLVARKDLPEKRGEDWHEQVCDFFGITGSELNGLFVPGTLYMPWAKEMIPMSNKTTAKEVAKSIRKFIKWKSE